jgi:8-oxo-dGTP pyrophosphatase MutT (NUDIX family)
MAADPQTDEPAPVDTDVVRAAGGLVIREDTDGRVLVAVVHRPRYDDWTFPKGKLQGGETDEQTALREVEEETGLRCRLDRDLGTVEYRDREDRRKIVRYWVMVPDGGTFTQSDEVDALRWVPSAEVLPLLTYQHDRELLAVYFRGAGDATAYLVRHGRAGSRSAWTEDDEARPLSKRGRRQAERLVEAFRGVEVRRVISSPFVRCVQTVRPLALDRGLPVETSEALREGAPVSAALALLAEIADTPSVLCSHGDVIPAVVLHFAELDMRVEGERDWRKGSFWALERRDGRFVSARYVPPPSE